MITVTRIRLDDGSPVVLRATAADLDLAVDDRHITEVGATALALALNGLAPGNAADRPAADNPSN